MEDKQVELQKDNSFVRFFAALSPEPRVVRLFDRKGYYTLHGADAELVARDFHHSEKALRHWKIGSAAASAPDGDAAKTLAYLVVRYGLEFESVITFVLRRAQLSLEVLTGSGEQWLVQRRASPGNVAEFEDELRGGAADGDSPVFMAVYHTQDKQQNVFGVAYADTTQRQMGVAEFVDSEQLANLESILIATGVRECCVPADMQAHVKKRLVELLERVEIPFVEKKRAEFRADDVEQDLTRLLNTRSKRALSAQLDRRAAMSATACVISHLELLGDERNFGKYAMKSFDLSQFMRLDQSALRALNLVPQANDVNQQMNLLSFLNKCHTTMGSRLLNQWIKQPLLNRVQILNRQKLLTAFYDDSALRDQLRGELKRAPDVERLCRKLISDRANLQDLCVLYQFTLILPSLRDALAAYAGAQRELVHASFLAALQTLCNDCAKYQQLIEASVDLDALMDSHDYVIKAEYSEQLQLLDEKKRKYYAMIHKLPEDIAYYLSLPDKKLHLEHSDKCDGWYFRLSRNDEKEVRAKLKGEYAPFETSKQGVKFRGRELKVLNEKYQKYANAYKEEQQSIVLRVLGVAKTYVPVFARAAELVARLDVLLAWAHQFATSGKEYCCPTVVDMGGDMIIKEGRHPCMELLDGVHFIPNDVEFRRDSVTFHIITGPNMGGKSTHIRTAGLIVLMAQLGCFVPATEAQIPICDCILARVGAGDSQLRGISTFMAEMLETAAILQTATKHSLVIIDELGRGTSTYDGFGLAYAISEEICKKIGSYCFFATHFHELTTLGDRMPDRVRNFHVKTLTSNGKLSMLFRVEPGASSQSLGIHVAEMAAFPPAVLRMAKRKASELEDSGLGEAAKRARIDLSAVQADETQRAQALTAMQKCVDESDESKRAQLLAETRAMDNPIIKAVVAATASAATQ